MQCIRGLPARECTIGQSRDFDMILIFLCALCVLCGSNASSLLRSSRPPIYIRKTPKRVWGIGAFSEAEMPRPRTRRVWAGSMTPSSHRRAVA